MKPLKVLILEDTDADLELILDQLQQAGFEPVWHRATTEAQFTAGLEPTLDLILADYQLPDYDGLQALRLLNTRQFDIPFILVSGVIGEELAVAMMKEGAVDYLLKDRLARLGAAVEQALAERILRRQKQAVENALSESSHRYQRLLENLPNGVAVLEDGVFVYVNPAGVRIIGAPHPEAVVGKSMTSLIHPAYRELVQKQLARLGAGENTPFFEGKFIRLDNKIIDLEIGATPFVDQTKEAIQLIFRDVTDRRRAQAELRHAYQTVHESEARFRATFEQVAVGIGHWTLNGKFLRVNQKFCDIVGYTRQELLELTVQAITHPDDWAASLRESHRLWSGETDTYHLEKRYLRRDGTPIWINLTVSLARGSADEPLYLISVVEDITERRHLEQQFQQAQKMEAVGQLASGIAHDFNNLLTAIMGYGELALRALHGHPAQADLFEIRQSARRAAGLTRQLLAFSRQQVLQPRLLDMNAVVTNMESLLRRLIGEDVDFVTSLTPNLWPVKADPGQLEQVLANLAVNARDAMPGGGHLRIETTNIDLTEIQTQLYGLTEPGPYVRLSLSDTGQGIDAETQAHIFEPFFTTKAPGHGTGLGLSTVHGIITQSGGHIQVVSQPNQGTTFEIDLPRSDGRGIDQAVFQDQAESQYQVAEAKTQPGDYIILVVEDEAIVRDLIGRLLTRAGYNFLSARDGIEALRLSQEQQGSLHLLLTDLTLPGGLNGHQVAHLLMQRHLRLKVLYTSGYPDRSITADELLKPGIAFIQKPFMPQDLLEKLSQLLGIVSENVTSS